MDEGWMPIEQASEMDPVLVSWANTLHVCRAFREGSQWIGLIPTEKAPLPAEYRRFEVPPTHFRPEIVPPRQGWRAARFRDPLEPA